MNKVLHFLIHGLIVRVHAPQLAACEKVTNAQSMLKMSCKFKSERVLLEVKMHRFFLVFWEANNMFYSVRTATTSACKTKEVNDFDKGCKFCCSRYPEFSLRSLLASKCDMLEHKCMFRFIFRKIIRLLNGRKFWPQTQHTYSTNFFSFGFAFVRINYRVISRHSIILVLLI